MFTSYALITIIAILVGRFGFKLKLVAYTTTSASMMIRDIGLVLFLASVGITIVSTGLSVIPFSPLHL